MAVTTLKWRRLCDGFPKRVGGLWGGCPVMRAAVIPSEDRTSPSSVSPSRERPSLALQLVMLQPQENRRRLCASWGVGYSIPSSNGFGWMSVRSCVAPPELVGQATWQGSRASVDSIPFLHGEGEEGKPLSTTAESEDGGSSPWLEPGRTWLCKPRSLGSECFSGDAFALCKGCS